MLAARIENECSHRFGIASTTKTGSPGALVLTATLTYRLVG